MIFKYQYSTQEERDLIISQNDDKILIEEQNITEGNFLLFSNVPRLEDRIEEIANTVDLLLLKQEGIVA